MQRERQFWRDKEKRRALLLSLLLHLAGIFAVIYAYVAPTPLEPENFIVLELGPSEQAEPSDAAAAAEPAPQAAEPQVASEAAGAPRTPETAPAPNTAAPEAQAEAAPDAPRAQNEPISEPPLAPQASVPAPDAQPLDLPPQDAATTLPEVEEVELEPQPLAEPIQIPQPSAAAAVPEARSVALTPRVEVPSRVAVPEPSAQVSVTSAQPVPTPQAQASIPEARPVPTPEASASVPERTIPTPQVQASAPSAQPVPTPQAQVSVPSARPLAATPGVQVTEAEPVPSPQATATANVPDQVAAETPNAEETQSGDVAARADADALGGNAADTGQTESQDAAQANNAGAAAAPSVETAATGAPASRTPYEVSRSQPIAAILDNALGYPQTGLREAGAIYEMPVEGGLTRLMSVYDNPNSTPSEVGPIRSARPYFVQAASAMDGTLVHVGGSPGALNEIARGDATLDALQAEQADPFFVVSDQRAPYSTYASGDALRQAVTRLELDASSVLRGSAYRPADNAPGAERVVVDYSSAYSSGFRYVSQLAQYRWLRNGDEASDARGEDVLVDAVVVADIVAQPLPGDPEGRLYIPYRGGDAALYLRGKALPGTWTSQGGFTFVADNGETIELAPYKHWILFTPSYAEVSAE